MTSLPEEPPPGAKTSAFGQEASSFYSGLIAAGAGSKVHAPAPVPAAAPAAPALQPLSPATQSRPPRGPSFLPGGVLTDALVSPPTAGAGPARPVSKARLLAQGDAIPRSNIGHKLLRAAGWEEGQGLGLEGQGRATPLQPVLQPGTLGVGYGAVARDAVPPKPLVGDVYGQQEGDSSARAAAQHAARQLPDDPLASEDVETKVKRVKQVMAAEADEASRRAIQRYLHRAFSASDGTPTAADVNPLIRRNAKISSTNPLL